MSLDGGENEPTDAANEDDRHATKRSERKRQREKQRRSDLSSAFDELAAFIVQVEPESGDLDPDAKKKRKKSDGGEDASGITRLELIGRALRIMRRLHTENEERKRIIAGIQEKGGASPNDNVLVMVPTLTPTAEDPYPVARAQYPAYPGYPPPYYHGSHSQQPPVPDYSSQLQGRGGQPQYHPAQWSGYHGRGPPHGLSPQGGPPPFGTPSSQHRLNAQGHGSYTTAPRSGSSSGERGNLLWQQRKESSIGELGQQGAAFAFNVDSRLKPN
eukprot:scaffold66_cov115-Cylindrotheca_fusiformis.AAC.8